MPDKEAFDALFGPPAETRPLRPDRDVLVEVSDSARLRVRFHLAAPEDPLILAFPGEREAASHYHDTGERLVAEQVSLVVAEHRGTGGSSGSRELAALPEDATAVFDYLRDWREKEGFTGPVILMARSLAASLALFTAARYPKDVSGIILLSGFARAQALLEGLGLSPDLPGIADEPGFDNLAMIKGLDIPVLIIHGQEDQVVPLIEAMTLHQHSPARNKQLVVVPAAGHDDLDEKGGESYLGAVVGFCLKLAGRRKKSRRVRKRARKAGPKIKARLQYIEVQTKPKL